MDSISQTPQTSSLVVVCKLNMFRGCLMDGTGVSFCHEQSQVMATRLVRLKRKCAAQPLPSLPTHKVCRFVKKCSEREDG